MPSLRIDQSDLKCKNGCDFYGNPQWQGYCSKCYREQQQQQRRAEKAEKASAGTLPKPETKKPDHGLKLTTHSSFSKFEEKRLRQSETLKKANLLKFTVFKKSNTEEQEQPSQRKPSQFKVPEVVHEEMKRDFRARFPHLRPQVERDARLYVSGLICDVLHCFNRLTVDELSERVQRQYQRFMRYMENSSNYATIDAETREKLVDFIEKHAMAYLHDMPSIVFSPYGTDDERLDRVMFERIQQLSWVGERHLECRLDRNNPECRQLLYKAISELLGMDAARSPGGKLARVRRAAAHVLALCGGASADDLLPALIFTVLKANPPRLVSNINFVTRFCNAQRLMTGEGGYYFTNLCCAVSFIENLSAESLSMDKKEFDCYMAMPATIGGSAWAAALSLCGAAREAAEQRQAAERLQRDIDKLAADAQQLAANADTFEKEIEKKVQDVLAKTPLEITPRRELPRLAPTERDNTPLVQLAPTERDNTNTPLVQLAPTERDNTNTPLVQLAPTERDNTNTPLVQLAPTERDNTNTPLVQLAPTERDNTNTPLVQLAPTERDNTNTPLVQLAPTERDNTNTPLVQLASPSPSPMLQPDTQAPQATTTTVPEIRNTDEEPILTLDSEPPEEQKDYQLDTPKLSPSKSPLLDQPWEMKQTNSLELLTPSPLGFAPFDRSMDELLTPDEFVSDIAPGLGNINYDIDLSDFSGDNSFAEDAPRQEPKDPFSPVELKNSFGPFAPQPSKVYSAVLEKFDEFSLVDTSASTAAEPFEVVHRPSYADEQADTSVNKQPRDPFSPVPKESTSILDDSGSPTSACLLPSPMLPQTSKPS